ncbi:hypothetical protein [Tomitella gaofuii]|uniref:hypothetical protein n=1 Tax=Tomitella gaofuii TaxID=2760083 RepID=UPI0015F8A88C|nr:hypothetical protein [Tomitella gaofuii]
MTDGTPPAVFTEIAEHWRPEPAVAEEVLPPWPAAALAALLSVDPPAEDGGALPPLWHEVYLRDRPRIADLGEDGHPSGGPLLPPIPRRRRMFGGGRIIVHAPLHIGERVRRTSAVRSVRVRHGSSGWLLLVTERHVFEAGGRLRVEDERDIVYRMPGDVRGAGAAVVRVRAGDESATGTASAAEASAPILRLDADERLLMLVSALTYNPHRIHYDRDYATRVEGHPGLVVHGPLLALEGIEAARRIGGRYPDRVDYRLTAAAHPGAPVDFAAAPADGPGDGPIRTEPGSVRIGGRQGGRLCIRVDAAWDGAAGASAGAVSPPE